MSVERYDAHKVKTSNNKTYESILCTSTKERLETANLYCRQISQIDLNYTRNIYERELK